MPSEPWCRAHISSTGQTSTEAISNQNVICCSGAELYTRITSLALNPIGDLRSSIFLVPATICLAYTGLMDRIAAALIYANPADRILSNPSREIGVRP